MIKQSIFWFFRLDLTWALWHWSHHLLQIIISSHINAVEEDLWNCRLSCPGSDIFPDLREGVKTDVSVGKLMFLKSILGLHAVWTTNYGIHNYPSLYVHHDSGWSLEGQWFLWMISEDILIGKLQICVCEVYNPVKQTKHWLSMNESAARMCICQILWPSFMNLDLHGHVCKQTLTGSHVHVSLLLITE